MHKLVTRDASTLAGGKREKKEKKPSRDKSANVVWLAVRLVQQEQKSMEYKNEGKKI